MESKKKNKDTNELIFKIEIDPQTQSFPGDASGKELAWNAGDLRDVGSIPELGRSPEEGNGNPLWYSCWIPWTDEPRVLTEDRKDSDATEETQHTRMPK